MLVDSSRAAARRSRLLGAYSVAGHAATTPSARCSRGSLYHVAELDLYLGVVPFAALLVLAAPRGARPRRSGRSSPRRSRSPSGSSSRSRRSPRASVARIEERNLFYLAPLLLIALARVDRARHAAAAARGRRRRGRRGRAPGALPFATLIGDRAPSRHARAPAVVVAAGAPDPRSTTSRRRASSSRSSPRLLFVLVCRAGALAAASARRVGSSLATELRSRTAARHSTAVARRALPGITTAHRDWIDRAVGRDARRRRRSGRAATRDQFTLWENEFFNRSVGPRLRPRAAAPGGAARDTPSRVDRATASCATHGRPSARVRAHRRLVAARRDARSPRDRADGGSCSTASAARSRSPTRAAALPATPGRAARVTYTRLALPRRQRSRSRSASDRDALRDAHADRRRVAGAAASSPRDRRADGHDADACRCARATASAASRFRSRRTAVPAMVLPAQHATRARSARTSSRFELRTPSEDRLRRQAAVAPADRRRQLHPRLARGLAEAAGGEHEVVAFAPASARGRRAIAEALDGIAVERALVALPVRARVAHGLEPRLGRPPAERFVGRFDVLHFSRLDVPAAARAASARRRSTTSCPLRFPEWVHRAHARGCTGAKYRARGADVRRRLRQLGATPPRRRASARRARASGSASRIPGVGAGRSARRRARPTRPPVRAHGRDARAAQEPRRRCSRRSRCSRRRARARRRRRRGLGRAAAARPARRRPARLRRRRGAARGSTAARRSFVYPSRFEGFGMPVVEAMACGDAVRRLVAPVARRGVRRRGRPRRSGEPRGDRGGDPRGARAARRAARAGPRARARGSRGARPASAPRAATRRRS